MSQNPVPVRPAATILLLRDAPSFQVLMVKRHHQIDFASGALVFPGGKLDPSDSAPDWCDLCHGWDAISPEERAHRIAALREAFEEAGVLLARLADGRHWSGDPRAVAAQQAVARGERPFIDLVRELDLRLDLPALTLFARWIAPEFAPKRFDTWFYVAVAPDDQLAACDGGEAVDAEWIAPLEALNMAASGQRTIIFPTRMNLKLLGESLSAQSAIAASKIRELVVVQPWVEKRESGPVLVIPGNAGYGDVAEDLRLVGV